MSIKEKILLLKRNYVLTFSVAALLVASVCVLSVSAVTYTYAMTETAVGVPNITIGYPIHVDPYTTDPTAAYVRLDWFNGQGGGVYGQLVWSDTSSAPPTFDGSKYHFVVPDHTPTTGGTWWLQATFYNAAGAMLGTETQAVPVLIPLTPVPELPILGSIGGLLVCLFAGFFYISKAKKQKLL